MVGQHSHESFDREETAKVGSDRSFGYVFAAVFLIIAAIKYFNENSIEWIFFWIAAAAVVLTIALVVPRLLHPFNRLWFRFGLLLHHIVNPIVMGLIFFTTVTPIGLVMRCTGNRPLHLKFEPKAESYWIARSPPGPAPGSFTNQF